MIEERKEEARKMARKEKESSWIARHVVWAKEERKKEERKNKNKKACTAWCI